MQLGNATDLLATLNFTWFASLFLFWGVIVMGNYNRDPRQWLIFMGGGFIMLSIVFTTSVFMTGELAIEGQVVDIVLTTTRVLFAGALGLITIGTIIWARDRK